MLFGIGLDHVWVSYSSPALRLLWPSPSANKTINGLQQIHPRRQIIQKMFRDRRPESLSLLVHPGRIVRSGRILFQADFCLTGRFHAFAER